MKSRPRILIAEDNVALNGILRFNLTQAGFEVTSARDGREAADFALQDSFDFIVSDQQMPRMTGVELCREVRSTKNAAVPFVLLTAKAFEVDVQWLQSELQVVAVIQKPFSPRAIVDVINRCLLTAQENRVQPDSGAGLP